MLQQPGQDDHDGDLELILPDELGGGDGPDGGPAGSPSGGDDCQPLDDDREQVGYELYEWEPDELDELDDALHEAGIPHEWVSEGFEVVIHVEDEARVDAMLPGIRFPDELPPEADDGDDTDVEVLSALFVAADRIRGNATGDGVASFLDAAERIGDLPPYGLEEAQWEAVVEDADALLEALHAGAPEAAVVELAEALRDRVRPLV